MLKIASYRVYYICFVVITLVFTIGGDIPNYVFRLLIICIIYCISSLIYYTSKLKYKFEVDKTEVYANEDINIRYKVSNLGSFIPANNILFRHNSDERLKESSFEENLFIPPNDYYQVKKVISPKRRGYYNIGISTIRTKDVFGFFYIDKKFEQSDIIIVYPKFKSIRKFDIQSSDLFGEQSIISFINEDYTSIKKIRKYVNSDPLKKINQKVTAKMGEIYVNEFDSSSKPKLILLADSYNKSFLIDDDFKMEDTMVEYIASVSNFALMKKIEVMYIDSSYKNPYFNARDMKSFMPLMKILTGFEATGIISFERFLLNEALNFSYNSSLVIFTPVLDYEKCNVILSLKKRGFKIMVIIFNIVSSQKVFMNLLERETIKVISINPNQKKG